MEVKKLIPELRFNGFENEWKYEPIGKFINLISGFAFKGDDISEDKTGVPILRGINITEGYIRHNDKIDRYYIGNTDKLDKIRVKEGDLVLGMDGSKVGKNSALVTEKDVDSLLIQRVARIRAKKDSCLEFIYLHINSIFFHKYVDVVNTSSGIPHISSKQINDFKIHFPLTLPEQQKIASFLSAVDEKIQQLTRKKELLEQYKKGVMQQLFSGKLRFKDENGKEYPEWEVKKLSHYLQVSKLKNIDYKYDKSEVLSVSGEFGIVNQIEFQGRSFAGESVHNYGVVLNGDIVYTKSPLKANPYGIIKVNKGKNGIVSTLYAVYNCKKSLNGEYLDYYFQLDENTNSYLRPLVQKGSKNDMKINNEKVLIDPIFIPSLIEQNKIVDFIKELDTKIDFSKKELDQTQTFKKGLLQKMFV